jgi:gamma-glutamyltranspeptidase/glutathione hydrolase
VSRPRLHHQWQPDHVLFEPGALSAEAVRALRELGHELRAADGTIGAVNAIGLDAAGRWVGVADPRRGGQAAGY